MERHGGIIETPKSSGGGGGGGAAKKNKKSAMSMSARAQITFPVSRIRRYMRTGHYANHIGTTAAVYLASVVEYLTAEILELAGNVARDNGRARITPRHVMLAIRNDEELDQIMSAVIIPEAGVLPKVLTRPALPRKMAREAEKRPTTSSPAEPDG